MACGDVGEIELLKHAVLRAAAWPIETVYDFRAPALARAASALFDAERSVLARREATVAALHAAVPRFDQVTRAYLLSVKRHVHGQIGELPKPTPWVSAQLSADTALARLIDEEGAARKALAEQSLEFECMYAAELQRQRCVLRTKTADSRFLNALILANPLVAARWTGAISRIAGRGQKERRLERTVFRYLMRAVGRPTPHGAWAGVSLISPATAGAAPSPLHVTQTPARYEAAVNLLPFTLMLRALVQQDRYRRSFPLRLNPTLHMVEAGWRYAKEGGSEWFVLPRQRLLSVVLRYFQDGHSHPALPLLDALERDSGADAALREAFERVVNGLINEDVLRVDLCLPARAANVWEALDTVVPRLLEPERTRWSDAIRRIKLHCEQLGENFEGCMPAEVDALRRAIAEDLQGLWQAAELPGKNPEPAVRLDMRLPFAVAWSTATFEAVQRATKALLAFHAADGGAELFRRQSIYNIVCSLNGRHEARLLAFLADGPVDPGISEPRAEEGDGREGASAATRELLFSRLPPNSAEAQAAAEHCRTWEDFLEAVHDRRIYSLPARAAKPMSLVGPWGSLLLRFGAGDTVWIGPGRPESALFVARFANLFGEPGGNGEVPLLEDLREHLAVAADNGIELADVVGWHPLNPNAAIRPSLAPSVLDAHGDRETNLQDLQLRIRPNSARPWLLRPHDSLPLVPVLTCAANLGARDGINSALAKLACAHGWEFLAFGFPPLRAELLRWHHLPRLLLDDGMVLAAERWTLDQSVVSQLGRCSGLTRYLAWRREADRMKLPALVHMRTSPDAPELLMCTESPLAVQCCFDGSNDRASDLSLTELAGDPESWPVTDAEGRHYLSEVAVTWCADYYWGEMAKEVSA